MQPPTKFEAYRVAVEASRHDTDNLWRTFSAFLVSETVLLGFLLSAIANQDFTVGRRLPVFLGSLAGILLCGAWAASYARATKIRDLRIHQARELEDNPSRVMRDGAELVGGHQVNAGGVAFKLHPWLSTNVTWLYLLIFVFASANLLMAIWAWG